MKADFEIQEDVVEELAYDPALDAAGIGVAVSGGIVTLTGSVGSYAEKLAAERAAQRVRGVRAVALELGVELPAVHQRTDADIAAGVLEALAADVTLPADRISVAVEKGCVTLTGQVEWQFQKENAQHALAHHVGIRSIDNRITVAPRPSVADVKEHLRRTFQRNAEIDAERLEVEVKDATVTLRGRVHSLSESNAAMRSAFSVPGVAQVKNLTYVSE